MRYRRLANRQLRATAEARFALFSQARRFKSTFIARDAGVYNFPLPAEPFANLNKEEPF